MITDPIFYRLFETSPETFFLLLGMSADMAKETAARYEYKALEFKETSHRVDGVFLPREAGLPLYFLEGVHPQKGVVSISNNDTIGCS
jgi:predicted transposase YdaD